MFKRSTVKLLRFHFSFFLLPVYLFALSQVPKIETIDALIIFFVLHLLVYPSSNGYNSYMDRDETSVGGIAKPLQPTRELFLVSVIMDISAILISLIVSIPFACSVLLYILASRAYSYRGIRLKKYPILGYLTVCIFQGAVTYWMVYHGASADKSFNVSPVALIAASLLMGSFYPLTQIYQHEADLKDGVKTISYLLGYKGTFVFTAIVYSLAMGSLAIYFKNLNNLKNFWVLTIVLFPVLLYFFYWANLVWKDYKNADFKHTMNMNLLASVCTNTAFIIILTGRLF